MKNTQFTVIHSKGELQLEAVRFQLSHEMYFDARREGTKEAVLNICLLTEDIMETGIHTLSALATTGEEVTITGEFIADTFKDPEIHGKFTNSQYGVDPWLGVVTTFEFTGNKKRNLFR